MKTIKVIEKGIEHELTLQSHEEIAEQISGSYDCYKLICSRIDNAINIYLKSNYYFDNFRTKIAKLYFDINTDTVYYSQYGFKQIGEHIGIYSQIVKHLRDNDVIILKGKTNSRVEYRKRMNAIKKELNNSPISDGKFTYIHREFFHKWK